MVSALSSSLKKAGLLWSTDSEGFKIGIQVLSSN